MLIKKRVRSFDSINKKKKEDKNISKKEDKRVSRFKGVNERHSTSTPGCSLTS